MIGPWQHEIPELLQRDFGIRRSGKPNEIWVFARDKAPEVRPIKEMNADDNFYSEPSPDIWATLDGKITKYETPLAVRVNAARATQPGESFDNSAAAEIVTHLAVRTRHVREVFQQAVQSIGQRAVQEFADSVTVKRVLGLDSFVPSDVFRDSLKAELRRAGLVDQIPEALAVQIAFQLARESFDELSPAAMGATRFVGVKLIEEARNFVRQAHNNALTEVIDTPNYAWDYLRSLLWTIEAAVGDAVLPDCVAVGIDRDGTTKPLLLADRETLVAIVMPLSSRVFLVDRKTADEALDLADFNRHAAACSYRHYQASTNTPEIAGLRDLIGTRSSAVVDHQIRKVLLEHFPHSPREGPGETARDNEGARRENGGEQQGNAFRSFQYEISFIECADQASANKITAVVQRYISNLSKSLPLARLDGITFASDYPAALRAIDRGIPGSRPVETINAELGTGLVKTVSVVRDGVVKARVVLVAEIGHELLNDDAASTWADYVLVYELALVSMIEIVDTTLRGQLLKPIENYHEAWLFECVNSALDAYVAATLSAGLGDSEWITNSYRDSMIAALEYAGTKVSEARLAYRQHADLEVLMNVAAPAIRHMLTCAANLLGHCDALDRAVTIPGDPLADALDRCGLTRWLRVFQTDLRKFRLELGKWRSFDELLRFNRHVERVFWQFGMFPWCTPEGVSRVEVPPMFDAASFRLSADVQQ